MLGGKHRQDFGTLLSILNAANSLNASNQERTVSTSQLSFPHDRPNLSVLLPWPLRRPCVIYQWLLPLQRTENPVAIVAVNTAVTVQTQAGQANNCTPFQPTDEGSQHCWLSPLIAIVRSTARKITGRMFDEGGAHRSSLTADRQVKSFHAFQDPAE